MMLLSETVEFVDLMNLVDISKKELNQLDNSYSNYPIDVFYDYIKSEIRKEENKFFGKYNHTVNLCNIYEYEDMQRDMFCDGAECKDLFKELLECMQDFMNNQVARQFDEDITFTFDMNDGENVEVKIECENPEYFLRTGMNAWGEFEYTSDDSLDKPYYIIRECLHYYEACECKPRLNFRYDYDNLYNFKEDGCSIFNKMIDKWLNGELIGEILIDQNIPGVGLGFGSIHEFKELVNDMDFPEKFDDALVNFCIKPRSI